jgi:hypothetical protein
MNVSTQAGVDTPLLTVKRFAEKHADAGFTEASLRAIIFNAEARPSSIGMIPGNGFAPAILRLGSKVLLDEHKFFEILRAKQSQGDR